MHILRIAILIANFDQSEPGSIGQSNRIELRLAIESIEVIEVNQLSDFD